MADQPLEAGIGRQDIERPGLEAAEDVGHGPIQGLDVGPLAQPLAVGRVADQAAMFPRAGDFSEIAPLKMDLLRHAGLLGMDACQTQSGLVDVGPDDPPRQVRQR